MKKNYILTLFLSLFILIHSALGYSEEVIVGDKTFKIPAPTSDFGEMSPEMLQGVKMGVPPQYRLLCTFSDPTDEKQATNANVQSIRSLEGVPLAIMDFQGIVAQTEAALGNTDLINQELQNQSKKLENVSIGRPQMLGNLYKTDDSYAYAMILKISDEQGNEIPLLIGSAMLYIKSEVLMSALVIPYEGSDSITKLKIMTENWKNQIVEANP